MSVTIHRRENSQLRRTSGEGTKERTLLSNERQTPSEDVHEVRKPVRVRRAVELADVHDVVLVLEHGGLVVVNVEVVGRREDRHDGGETGRLRLAVHAVTAKRVWQSEKAGGRR
jgi:SepF-like predicted cell division protein (DUF552 family)